MKTGDLCYVPVTDEMLHTGPGTPEGYVLCRVVGPTAGSPGCFDLEDTREALTPAGNAEWGAVPEGLCRQTIPVGGRELL
jgi:hypothetical protein